MDHSQLHSSLRNSKTNKWPVLRKRRKKNRKPKLSSRVKRGKKKLKILEILSLFLDQTMASESS